MKAVNLVYFGEHLIAERKLGEIENAVVRLVKDTFKEYGLKKFDVDLIRTAASQAIIKTVQLANELEKKSKLSKPIKK